MGRYIDEELGEDYTDEMLPELSEDELNYQLDYAQRVRDL